MMMTDPRPAAQKADAPAWESQAPDRRRGVRTVRCSTGQPRIRSTISRPAQAADLHKDLRSWLVATSWQQPVTSRDSRYESPSCSEGEPTLRRRTETHHATCATGWSSWLPAANPLGSRMGRRGDHRVTTAAPPSPAERTKCCARPRHHGPRADRGAEIRTRDLSVPQTSALTRLRHAPRLRNRSSGAVMRHRSSVDQYRRIFARSDLGQTSPQARHLGSDLV